MSASHSHPVRHCARRDIKATPFIQLLYPTMAYTSGYSKRNRNRRYRKRRNKKAPARSYVSDALHYAKMVAPYIGPMIGLNTEKKLHTVSIQADTIEYDAPLIQCLNSFTQGTTANQRVGNSIRARKLTSRWQVGGNQNANVRMIIFQWNADSTPVIGDVLDSPSTDLYDVFLGYNKSSVDCKILCDKQFMVYSDLANPNAIRSFQCNVNLGHTVKYDGTTSQPIYGGIWTMFISDRAAAGTPPSVSGQTNFYYVDN